MKCESFVFLYHNKGFDVQVKMLDPDSPEGPEIRITEVIINEQSPRFRAKFDFVYISATSMLTLTVFEKAGMWDSVMKFGKKVRSCVCACACPSLLLHSQLFPAQTSTLFWMIPQFFQF